MAARRSIAFVAIVLVALLGCAASDERAETRSALGDDRVTVGSFNFPESVLLAELYSQALEANGIRVERAFGLGPREFAGPALDAGLIELLPEYAGTALVFRSLGTVRPSADVDATHRDLERVLTASDVTALASAPAQSANTFVVARAIARRYHLARLSDLGDVADRLTFGGPPECPSRPLCLRGLGERYGLHFDEVVTLDTSGPVTHQALRDGDVDVALMFTTDPSLEEFVELLDDRTLQPAENVTPLVRREVLVRLGPQVAEAIDMVSRRLTTASLRSLNSSDAGEPGSADVAAIAAAWLQARGAS